MIEINLCADDFALREGIDNAIIELAAAGRISATSVLVTSPRIPAAAKKIAPFRPVLDVGLHFDLSEFPSLTSPGLRRSFRSWVYAGLAGSISEDAIASELRAQISSFQDLFGFLPSHVDGHEYVHQLPGIRAAFCQTIATSLPGNTYIRSCHETWPKMFRRGVSVAKTWAIGLPARRLNQLAQAANLPTNKGFSGAYSFSNGISYPKLFPRFLRDVNPGTIVVCHPGQLEKSDPIGVQRANEYSFFAGSDFPNVLAEANVKLVPFSQLLRSPGRLEARHFQI